MNWRTIYKKVPTKYDQIKHWKELIFVYFKTGPHLMIYGKSLQSRFQLDADQVSI